MKFQAITNKSCVILNPRLIPYNTNNKNKLYFHGFINKKCTYMEIAPSFEFNTRTYHAYYVTEYDMLCYAMLCYAMLCYAMLCYAIL